jgi:hypothetical protein
MVSCCAGMRASRSFGIGIAASGDLAISPAIRRFRG